MTIERTTPSHWFMYIDDTWVTIKIQVAEAFTEQNSGENNIKFRRQDTKENATIFELMIHHLS